MRQLLTLIVGIVLIEACFSQAGKAETIFYSLDSSSSPQPIRLVRFSSAPGNTNVTTITEIPGLISNPVDATIRLSSNGRLYLSPQDNTVYCINPSTGTILDSLTLPHDNRDTINGISVSREGLVYVSQDREHVGTKLWAVDFQSRQATEFLSLPFDVDDMDFDNEGNLIAPDLNATGNIYRIPLDGSWPQLVATLPVTESPIITFSSQDNAFYCKLTGGLNSGRGLYRLPWANGQPAGPLEYVKDIGNGQYAGLAAVPEPVTLSLLALGGYVMLRRRQMA